MIDYLKMKIGYFQVISYNVNYKSKCIEFILRCSNCGESIGVKIDRTKATRLKCKHCSGTLFIIAISERTNKGIPLDLIVISEYKYRKLRKRYLEEHTKISWIDWISEEYKKNGVR